MIQLPMIYYNTYLYVYIGTDYTISCCEHCTLVAKTKRNQRFRNAEEYNIQYTHIRSFLPYPVHARSTTRDVVYAFRFVDFQHSIAIIIVRWPFVKDENMTIHCARPAIRVTTITVVGSYILTVH